VQVKVKVQVQVLLQVQYTALALTVHDSQQHDLLLSLRFGGVPVVLLQGGFF